jgi:hypothetical protein
MKTGYLVSGWLSTVFQWISRIVKLTVATLLCFSRSCLQDWLKVFRGMKSRLRKLMSQGLIVPYFHFRTHFLWGDFHSITTRPWCDGDRSPLTVKCPHSGRIVGHSCQCSCDCGPYRFPAIFSCLLLWYRLLQAHSAT